MPVNDQSKLVIERRKNSYDWLKQNFHQQWRQVHRLYKCEVDPATDENTGDTDTTKTRIGMPDTWALVQREVARYTAQIPNLKFRADDLEVANRISRKAMYDWDRGGTQRDQKRHCAQACLFGISIRAWAWETIEFQRMRRVNPLDPQMDDGTRKAIADQYGDQISAIRQESPDYADDDNLTMAKLLAGNSRGKLLPLKENHKKYEGPTSDVLFIGDCYFEPNFRNLQKSNWFIVERRRNKAWVKMMGARYPELVEGFTALLDKYPKGSPRKINNETDDLRTSMMGDIDRVDTSKIAEGKSQAAEWTITEMWVPGEDNKVCLVAEENIWIGDVDAPYDLNGMIPFTEMVLIDDIISGIGDSHARIIRGLNELHNTLNNYRADLVSAILRPRVITNDREMYDNPEEVKRGDGLRMIFSRNPNPLQTVGEQAAIASVIASLQNEEGLMRMEQMATGEGNLSQAANVDPQQGRTATGARLLAHNQDVLTKSATDMLNLSLNDDAEMIYLLNRSEMGEDAKFDAAQYSRAFDSSQPPPASQPMTVSPLDFQIDGEIEAEVGSTLADDDEGEVVKAQNLFAMAVANPNLFNPQKARDNLLIRFGFGRELSQWASQPQPPAPPEPPKISLSVPLKFELLPIDLQVSVLTKAGIPVPPEMMAQAQAMQPAPPVATPGAPPPEGPAAGVAPPGLPPPGAAPPLMARRGPAPPALPPPNMLPTALEAAEGHRV